MGLGKFENGRFTLSISFRHPTSEEDLDAWEHCFRRASKLLCMATKGQARISRITYANPNPDQYTCAYHVAADVFVRRPGRSHVVTPGAFGEPGAHMDLGSNAVRYPLTVVHEFGHHVFGLGDEYEDNNSSIKCTENQQQKPNPEPGEPAEPACIMGARDVLYGDDLNKDIIEESQLKKGWITDFCGENHDEENPSKHKILHGKKSCAELIYETFGIDIICGSGDPCDDHDFDEALEWTAYDLETKTSVVLEDSLLIAGPVAGGTATEGLTKTADHFREVAAPSAVVETFRVGTPPSEEVLGSVNEALDAGRNAITGTEGVALSQTIVLFSTGAEPISDPVGRGQALEQERIRVLAVGLGNDPSLQHLAEQSRGKYYEVDPALGAHAVRDQVLNLANELAAGPPIKRVSLDSLPSAGTPLAEFYVDEGSRGLRLVFSHGSEESLQLSLINPADQQVPPAQYTVTDLHGALAVSLPHPEPGCWKVHLASPRPDATVPYILTPYSCNPDLFVGTFESEPCKVGDEATVYVVVSAPMPLSGLSRIVATVISPSSRAAGRPPSMLSVKGVARELPLSMDAAKGGAYELSFRADEPGAYDVEIDILNDGSAVPAGERAPGVRPIPEFRRLVRFPVHVND